MQEACISSARYVLALHFAFHRVLHFNRGRSLKAELFDFGDIGIIVRDAKAQLDKLIESQQLMTGGLLKINGRASIPVSYLIAHELEHLFSTIAVFDPKIGGKEQNHYVVAINYDPSTSPTRYWGS